MPTNIPTVDFPDKESGSNPETDHNTQLWKDDVNQLKATANGSRSLALVNEFNIENNRIDLARTRQPFIDITDITIVPSGTGQNTNPTVRERVWWAINTLPSPYLTVTTQADVATVYIIVDGSITTTYFEIFKLRKGVGVYGLGQDQYQISQINSREVVVLDVTVGFTDPTEGGIAGLVNSSVTEYNITKLPVFEVDVNGTITKYMWNPESTKDQTLIGGTTDDVVDADFIVIGSAESTAELEPQTQSVIKVFDTNGDPKLTSDLLFQDTPSVSYSKNATTGALEATAIGGSENITLPTDITSPSYTLQASDAGFQDLLTFNSADSQNIIVNENVFTAGNIVNIWRDGDGIVSLDFDNAITVKGVPDAQGSYALRYKYSMGSLIWDSPSVVRVINLGANSTSENPIVITSYSTTQVTEAATINITVVGSNFTSNTTVTASSGLTINTVTFVDSAQITINVTATGAINDTITLTYNNGFFETVDTNALTISAPALLFDDEFNYVGVPDVAKWTLINPNSNTITFDVATTKLEVRGISDTVTTYGQNSIVTIDSFDMASFKAFHFTILSANPDSNSAFVFGAIGTNVPTDTANRFGFSRSLNAGKLAMFLVVDSVTSFSGEFDLDISTFQKVRVTYDGTTMNWDYWDLSLGTPTWVTVGTVDESITGSWFGSVITVNTGGVVENRVSIDFDDVKVSGTPYTTQNP